jgi:hypothetical protein
MIHFALALPKASQSAIAGCGFFVCSLLRVNSHRCQTKKPAWLSPGRLCDLDRIQTYNLLIRSQVLYSIELQGQSAKNKSTKELQNLLIRSQLLYSVELRGRHLFFMSSINEAIMGLQI